MARAWALPLLLGGAVVAVVVAASGKDAKAAPAPEPQSPPEPQPLPGTPYVLPPGITPPAAGAPYGGELPPGLVERLEAVLANPEAIGHADMLDLADDLEQAGASYEAEAVRNIAAALYGVTDVPPSPPAMPAPPLSQGPGMPGAGAPGMPSGGPMAPGDGGFTPPPGGPTIAPPSGAPGGISSPGLPQFPGVPGGAASPGWPQQPGAPAISPPQGFPGIPGYEDFQAQLPGLMGAAMSGQPNPFAQPAVAAGAPGSRTVQPGPSESVHVLQQNETLWGLAQRYTGDGRRWTELRDRNVQPYGPYQPDPNNGLVVYAGDQLVLPAAYNTAAPAA